MNTYLKLALIFSAFALLSTRNYVKCDIVPLNYDLKLEINYQDEKLHGNCRLDYSAGVDDDTLPVILYRLLKVNSVTDADGRPLNFTQQVVSFSDFEPLQVNFVQITAGNRHSVIIDYDGYLLGYSETGMNYIKDRIDPKFTILRTDCYAYPVIGKPSLLFLRKSVSKVFDYKISVTVPDSIYVVNGGEIVSKKSDGNNTIFEYKNIKPSWRIDICAGKYDVLKDLNFNIYYFPEDSRGAAGLLENAVKAFQLFSRWFGSIENPGFSIIEIPEGWGSQTDVSCIIQTAAAFRDNENIDEVYHEISHLWNVRSTDSLPCRVESEGLATFLQFLAKERLDGRQGLLDSSAERIVKGLKRTFVRLPDIAGIPMIDFGKKNVTNHSYTKGMLLYYLLYKITGDEDFFSCISEFYKTYRKTGASINDFTSFYANKHGSEPVKKIFYDWIFSSQSSDLINSEPDMKSIVDYYKKIK